MKLYGADVCPFVHRVRLVLAEKRIEHEYVAIDLGKKPSWYYDVLPTGKVPLLEHNGFRIWESDIVCEYLDEAFLSPPLRPKEPGLRAQLRLIFSWGGSHFISTFYKLLAAQDPESQEQLSQQMMTVLKEMDERLSVEKGPFFQTALSLADLGLYPWFERWAVLEHYRGLKLPRELTHLNAWMTELQKRDSVKELRVQDDYFIGQYRGYAEGTRIPA